MSAAVSISFFITSICKRICVLLFVFIFSLAISKCSADSTFHWFGFSGDGGEKSDEDWSWLSWIPLLSRNTAPKPVQPKPFLQQWTDMVLGALDTASKHLSLLGHSIWSCVELCLGFIHSVCATMWRTLFGFENWRFLFVLLVLFLLTLSAIFFIVFHKRNKKLGRRFSDVVNRLALTSQRKRSDAQSDGNSPHRHVRLLIRATLWLVVGAAALSIPWEFIRLYQKEQAKRAARVYAGLPPDCEPSKLTLWQTVKSGLQWHFSWADHNPCERYYHAVLVDPLWEVTPMMVLSSVVARCILHPLELFSSSLGRSMKLFFTQIPSQWQPVIMVIILITFLAFLLMTCRYRIRMPMFFVFEPRTPTSNHVKSRRQCVVKAPCVGKSLGQGNKLVKDSVSKKSRRKKDPLYVPDSD